MDVKMLYTLDELQHIKKNFVHELHEAESGAKNSLMFNRNPFPRTNLVGEGEEFQVMCMGGSVFLNAKVSRVDDEIKILDIKTGVLQSLNDKKTLLSFFRDNLDPKTPTVGINFAFRLEPVVRTGVLDGKMSYGSKEHKFEGMDGLILGDELEKYIWKHDKRKIRVASANDTICLILSGLGKASWQTLGGGIVGTGMNFGFFLDENTVIALEAGGFDKFPLSTSGEVVLNESLLTDIYPFEKETSGGYLFKHYNALLKILHLDFKPITSTKELDTIARKNNGQDAKLAQDILERSASLVATQLAGVYEFKKQPSMTFVMEGSVYLKGFRYKECVSLYAEKLGVPRNAVKTIHIDHTNVLGAARLIASP